MSNEDGADFAHEEGDSDSETEWAVLMALGDRNALAAKKKGKKKEKKHRR
jgi:hypothetical protein